MQSKKIIFWIWCILLSFWFGKVWSNSFFRIGLDTLANIESEFGIHARKRVGTWLELMEVSQNISVQEKLQRVNRFFNQVEFIDDFQNWGQADYWATPMEVLTANGGDCEDYSIAKYFTLKALGIPERRMHLTYAKSLRLNQAHMVLTYTSNPGGEPLVLDNLIDEIVPAGQRTDLLPVYSFNGEGLWLAKKRGAGKRVGNSDRVGLWRDLLFRMGEMPNDK